MTWENTCEVFSLGLANSKSSNQLTVTANNSLEERSRVENSKAFPGRACWRWQYLLVEFPSLFLLPYVRSEKGVREGLISEKAQRFFPLCWLSLVCHQHLPVLCVFLLAKENFVQVCAGHQACHIKIFLSFIPLPPLHRKLWVSLLMYKIRIIVLTV